MVKSISPTIRNLNVSYDPTYFTNGGSETELYYIAYEIKKLLNSFIGQKSTARQLESMSYACSSRIKELEYECNVVIYVTSTSGVTDEITIGKP